MDTPNNAVLNSAVDSATYAMLHELMGADGFLEIIQVFREDTIQSVETLGQALLNQQIEVAASICHRLKSSSKLVGAMQLAQLVSEVEHDCQQHDALSAQQRYIPLKTELGRVLQYLDETQLAEPNEPARNWVMS